MFFSCHLALAIAYKEHACHKSVEYIHCQTRFDGIYFKSLILRSTKGSDPEYSSNEAASIAIRELQKPEYKL